MRTARWVTALAALWMMIPASGLAQPCKQEFASTFALIEKAIFENKGCTSSFCHDQAASGGLDLRPGVAYENLLDAPVASVANPQLRRVVPANKDDSLLWLNLAAATLPDLWKAPLRPMPQGGLPPLSSNELDAIRLWIESGAPREGTVPGTAELLDACLPPPKPLEVEPLAPPAPGTGVQLRAPTQLFEPFSERETCFITYYDLTGQVPQQFLGPNGDTFRYKRIENRQDPMSHHAVVIPYLGASPLDDPIWGEFRCGGGEHHGELCEPTNTASCGDDGICASTPMPSVGCIGFGPGDASIGVGNDSLFNTMAPGLSGAVPGVFAEAPLRGMLVWNSHGFNVTDTPGKLDIWVNLEFAAQEESLHKVERFTEVFAQFGLDVPAFSAQQMCAHWVFAPNTNLLEVSSHNHKRGKQFRVFFGRWSCQGGPNAGDACSPFGPEADLPSGDLCAGAPCSSRRPPQIGDCNGDLMIGVDELLLGIGISLGVQPLAACRQFDGDRDAAVSVYEVVHAVRDALEPPGLDAEEELFYTSLTYADPVVVRFDPPRFMGDARTPSSDRTITYCSVYDNGFLDAADVKRQSTSPRAVGGFPGGPCAVPEACTAGRVGAMCTGGTDAARNASCDSGAGDGDCDACRLRFGTTTEDEMFIISGAFFPGR